MSGDSIGVIVGGAVVLAALPVVVSGAVVAGTAYATIKAGMFAYRMYEKHKLEAGGKAGEQLRSATRSMQQRMDRQARDAYALREAHVRQAQGYAHTLQDQARAPHPNVRSMMETRAAIDRENERLRKERERLRAEALQDMNEILRVADRAARERQRLVNWSASDAAGRQAQEATAAAQAVLDARETLRLLAQMDDGCDPAFNGSLEPLREQIRQAEAEFMADRFQNACTVAQAAVSEGLMQLAQAAQLHHDADELRGDLLYQLEVMRLELEEGRIVSLNDEQGCSQQIDLAAYAQGHWEAKAQQVTDLMHQAQTASMAQLRVISHEVEHALRPSVRRMMHSAGEQMLLHFKKLYAAETIVQKMTDNNFSCVELVQPQQDPTQEMALRFADPSGTELVVSLDGMGDEDVMSLGLHVVPTEGRIPSEQELEAMRGHIMAGLGEKGAQADLRCAGNVGVSTSYVKYADLTRLAQAQAQVRTEV